MMTLPEKVKLTIKRYNMLLPGEIALIGLSGGPDSVCLLHILSGLKEEMSLSLYAAYIDHGLRPLDVPYEIKFCKELCERLSVPLNIRAINVKDFAMEKGMSKQEAARELRYRSLQDIGREIGASKIALGHNADDQVETFFINILRGTGPKGLSGIPPVRTNIIRPLIEIERREIEEYLNKNGITYIIDSSNLKEIYLRNRLRHIIIPGFKRINPSLTETMIRSMRILREEEGYFDLIITKTLIRLISRKKDNRIELFLSPMETIDIVILRRILRRVIDDIMGLKEVNFRQIEDILELITKGRSGDRLYLTKGVRIIKGYSTLIITSEPPIKIGNYTLSVPGEVVIKETGLRIKAEIIEEQQGNSATEQQLNLHSSPSLNSWMSTRLNSVVLDADKVSSTLIIRPREKGDYFYPIGFGKRKKLQDFFVDEKVPRDERDSIPLVLSGDDIIWVVGLRADERFKVQEGTRRFLKLKVEKETQ